MRSRCINSADARIKTDCLEIKPACLTIKCILLEFLFPKETLKMIHGHINKTFLIKKKKSLDTCSETQGQIVGAKGR